MTKKTTSSSTPPAPPSVGGLTPMPLATPQDFIDYWNKNVRDWLALGGSITPDESYWAPYASKIGILPDLIPEPYYGDPCNCSIVILNYNPGNPRHPITQHINSAYNPNTQCGWFAQQYSKAALTFPILGLYNPQNPCHVTSGPLSYDGRPWWLNREQWLKTLIGYTGVIANSMPFALELCGWHSARWRGVSYNKALLSALKDHLEAVLTQSICNSATKLGVCVGAAFGDYVLPALGFDQIPMPNSLNKYINTTKTKNKGKTYYYSLTKKSSRGYRLFKHRDTGALMINTWAPGGNGKPSDDFKNFDQQLIQEIYAQRLYCCLPANSPNSKPAENGHNR